MKKIILQILSGMLDKNNNSLDNYDIPIDNLNYIEDKEIIKEEYKFTLTRMLTFEKFIKEKLIFIFVSAIITICAFFINLFIQNPNTQILDFMIYVLLGLIISFCIVFWVTYNIMKDLKTRKLKLIELFQKK